MTSSPSISKSNSLMSGDLNDDEKIASLSSVEQVSELKAAVRRLMDLCADNGLEIPPELVQEALLATNANENMARPASHKEVLESNQCKRISDSEDDIVARMQAMNTRLQMNLPDLSLHIRDGSYKVTQYSQKEIMPPSLHCRTTNDNTNNDNDNFEADADNVEEAAVAAEGGGGPRLATQKIQTVRSESPVTKVCEFLLRCMQNKGDARAVAEEKVIMEGVNLMFEPGRMYLVLGAPGSGKSTLLKMAAENLGKSKDKVVGGRVSIGGVAAAKDVHWTNLVTYIDQIDRLYPFLTVFETFEYAWQCRSGGTHRKPFFGQGPEIDQVVADMDKELHIIYTVMEALGLIRVKDTFVGDQSTVRGVSGGEKKRVTVGEMIVLGAPVLCADEISTGLDAATTYDITHTMGAASRIMKRIAIVSLLQPPPETVANFDELVLLAEGKVIYSGPMEDVIDHFTSLGYSIPERMDMADWLQALPTKDGWQYLTGTDGDAKTSQLMRAKHMSPYDFHVKFYESDRGKAILEQLQTETSDEANAARIKEMAKDKYQCSAFDSLKRQTKRELLLWWRDKYQIKAKVGQSLIMGTIVGTLFFQSSDNPQSITGVVFQTLFYSVVGAMLLIIKQFPARSIFYKETDANFYPTWTYVTSKSVAAVPNAFIDAVVYGTMVYFLVGLAYDDGASIVSYFMFVLVLFCMATTTGCMFSAFSATIQTVTTAQAAMALTSMVMVLFSGFTVQPDVIPTYYIWIYWMNYVAWGLRAIMVNEYTSGKYDMPAPGLEDTTVGEAVLSRFGFELNGEAFDSTWVWWAVIFSLCTALIFITITTAAYSTIRFTTGASLVLDEGQDGEEEEAGQVETQIPFTRVDLTFRDVHYTVKSSISKEKLELLKGVDGVVLAGKMTALMGSSGAGKTTLMDVLAMRKNSGEITGSICLNGHPQDEVSFRRCTGYVEQFDTQTPQLTVRETMEFSAAMRLDEADPAVTPESVAASVDQTLAMLELTRIQHLQVGSDAEGGLSFEQRKRLSIAVELVSNPSIIFLDEPTSGLDARAASIVMKGLKRIALSGRAVVATIHQPSIAIFNDFDSLLLLKRGGETVYFGELGDESSELIKYLEQYDTTPRITPGENPATWMLTTIGAGSAQTKRAFDYASAYRNSNNRTKSIEMIKTIETSSKPEGLVVFASKYATAASTQSRKVFARAMKVYFRSPSYNTTRIIVSASVALLFGSVYASQRVPENESDMNSRMNSIFIACLFLCVNAQNTVLGVFERERNMFYRHKTANMYNSRAIAQAFTFAEIPFIFVTALVFVLIFYFIMGFAVEAERFFLFFLFCFLSLSTFTFLGQMLVSLFRDAETAQGLGGLVVANTSLFSGVLIRPDQIPNFWIFLYWILPGHYLVEGLYTSQFDGDTTVIEASPGSPFYEAINCSAKSREMCTGTVDEWLRASFPDFSRDNVPWDILYFVCLIFLSRVMTFYALTKIDYRAV